MLDVNRISKTFNAGTVNEKKALAELELHLQDGRTVSLQSTMTDVYPFLDAAFAGWCRQNGKRAEDCPFYDPENSRWFPGLEEM